jgi:uncharacterized protein YabE (DUF348 family)
MKKISKRPTRLYGALIALLSLVCIGAGAVTVAAQADAQSLEPAAGQHLITLHDEGVEKGILTSATTLRQALKEANVPIDPNDLIEPGLDEKLIATSYEVNIYRARPVTVIDGTVRQKVMSPYQTPKQIAQHAGILLHDEDEAALEANTDMVSEGAGIQLKIDRATEFTLVLYGKKMTAYTREKTVNAMLEKKNIEVGANDTLSVAAAQPLTKGMTVELWRNGKQTVTEEKDVPFETEKIKDMDRPVGYREVKTPGETGKRSVTYEVEMKNGQEVARAEIQSIITKEPKKQVEVVGAKPSGDGLSKGKGVFFYTDSQGVVHRETYYDLPMSKVMISCGGGTYSIRADGAKVDGAGYILIAANLNRYPRCSIVETSLGLGKVYDTGGFAAVHPDGFDLATDWSNNDGN